jgi:tetratricopeptide (TPR) repeat protein
LKDLLLYLLLLILAMAACSSETNTWTSKAYHNTTAHFNGYYYARDEIEKVETALRKSHVDDYNRILSLYPSFDSSFSKSFEKEIQEAIKMASIAIQRHPNSKWVDDAYILVGKSRHYSMDWGNAIQTFKYTNKISKNPDTKHFAIINLIRTYIEHKEFNNAQAAIDFLQKQDLSKLNKKRLFLEKAYFYQLHNDYDNMVRNLTQASPYLKKADRRGRIYFIIGQVYQKLGFESEAYNYYKKCLGTNPEYEVDFYARLYMAQVTEISRSKDVNTARKSFKKLLKDLKNKEFKDKIYYEMGIFELKQNNLKEAIGNFNLSVKHGTNKRIDGEAYLRIGEIYYDTLKNYELSQAYYDSAISALPQDYEGYDKIKTRQEILNEFVKHLKTIQWQDSLLTMASLDSVTLRKRVDSVVTKRIEAEEKRRAKNKKRPNRIEITANDNSSIFGIEEENQDPTASDNTDWYFSNPATLAAGQAEFARVWGNIPLQDNWRRSMRESALSSRSGTEDLTNTSGNPENTAATEEEADPVEVEFVRLNNEIPRTDEAKQEAYKKIEEAYFKLGEIYYFKLQENENAISTYTTLLGRFPETEHEPDVLYTLYLILKDSDPQTAEKYATQLKSKHPNSTFAKILINPAYLQESSQAAEKQKEIYKVAYRYFEEGNMRASDSVLHIARQFGETIFTPSLELLQILIIGETEDITKYQYKLDEFIQKYPATESADYASTLLQTSRNFVQTQEKKRGIQYIRSLEEPHYFVILYKNGAKLEDVVPAALEKFNKANFSQLNLNISNLTFNEQFTITFVADLSNVTTAIDYYRTFNENLSTIPEFRNHKFDNFVITKDNFDIFYRTKGLDEYLQFFNKNYPKENQ